MLRKEFIASIRATLVTLLLLGVAYPLVTTAVSAALFPSRAHGSFVEGDKGSELIAQPFTNAGYLQPRPSAAGDKGWDASGSSGSNLGPTSKALHDRMQKDVQRLLQENPDAQGPVPAELVSTTGSGLDPHVSPAAALWQAPRIAKARGVDASRVRTVIEANVEKRDLWFLGEPRVNVLRVNLAFDEHFGRPPMAAR